MRVEGASRYFQSIAGAWIVACSIVTVQAGDLEGTIGSVLDGLPTAIEYTVDRKSTVADAYVAKYHNPTKEYESQFLFLASADRWRYEMRNLEAGAFKMQYRHAFDGEMFRQLNERLVLQVSKKPSLSYDYSRVFNAPALPFKFLMMDQSLEDTGAVPAPDWKSLRDPLCWAKFFQEAKEDKSTVAANGERIFLTKDHTAKDGSISHFAVHFRKDGSYIPASVVQISSTGKIMEEIGVDEMMDLSNGAGKKVAFPKKLTEKLYTKDGELLVTSILTLRDVHLPESVEKSAFDISFSLARTLVDADNNINIPINRGK